jgi:hypothetical protein
MTKATKKSEVINTDEALMNEVNKLTTTSAKIRYLHAENKPTAQIAKLLGIRYQWVRNVLITPIKKAKA